MKDIRISILDLDSCTWFHLKDEAELMARALGIIDVEEFSFELYDFFGSFSDYFKERKVTIDETYKLLEKKIPILRIYNYSPAQFMIVHERLKFLINEFNPDALELVKYLSNKGIKIIVKSDWWRNIQEGMLKEFGLLDYIEELHCCDNQYIKSNPLSVKGIIKPGKEGQYIIIGDSLTSDIAFAKHAGIKSIWFNKDGKKENNTQYLPTFEVTSLLEVMDII